MKSFLKYMLATIAGILILNFLGFIILFAIIGAMTKDTEPTVLENSVLVAKFNTPILDRANDYPFSQFDMGMLNMEAIMGLDQILEDIGKAAIDDDISGIFLRLSAIPASMATVEEIRDALVDFRESGKYVIAHADMYTQKSYYLATAADKIYLTPTGDLDFKGLQAKVLLFKRALDKAGVDMQVIRHGAFKSAVEPFLTDEISDANREQLDAMISSVWNKMITEISLARGISEEDLNTYANQMTVTFDHQALEKKMIDGLKYYDEVLDEMRELTDTDEDDDIPTITLSKYKDVTVDKDKEATSNKVAVVYAMGNIVTGDAGEGTIGSDRIAKAIRKAREDDKVKAIVLRVNSGGGSALASEVIYREVKLAAEVKPVVASLGDVAASGGYYIVCPADTIVASETTITGSIGVFGLIPNFKELMNEKIGITTGVVKTNKYADIMSVSRPLTEDERAMIQDYVDDTYTTFVNHVAEGRAMTFEEVDDIGSGRVWSGVNAMEIGLIDVYGGLEKSIEIAAEMAGLENYRVTSLPYLEDPFTMLMKQFYGEAKTRIIRGELGNSYELYKKAEEISNMQGLQAIMPYSIDIY
ncbi:MAG: signal peptide peptidase SppA [Bacteroidales bacterium]|nr:signal peptide peptidase SppA [Bacteroidales bacterium]MDT8431621.1 signal peptide peptidase SppA [Bacteroidales bacterium]